MWMGIVRNMKMTSNTHHQGHLVSNCQVTHKDHREGLEYMRRRHTQFYETLTKIIDETKPLFEE
jgi:hypothetical protein